MAVRKEVPPSLSVVVGWCDEWESTDEEMGHERLLLWLSGRISGQDGAHCYWWELTAVCNKPWLFAEPLVDLDIGSLLGPRVQDEARNGRQPATMEGNVSFGANTSVVRARLLIGKLRCLCGVLEERNKSERGGTQKKSRVPSGLP